jgi:3-oxoacyl-[acyl-carrier protein] reductase
MSDLKGKVAVVTGASKGIGASIAKHLAAAGASVVVNYATSKEGADHVVAEIKAKGGKAVAVGGSVAKSAEIPGIIAAAKKEFGRLDILVNNAGVYEFGTLEAITEESFHRQFNTNVLGLILTTQAAVKEFGAEGGSVINISSIVARLAVPGSSVYAGTKASVDVITSVLAKELGPKKIRVNAVNPGLVETEGTKTAGFSEGEFADDYVKNAPLGRLGQPQDIARVVTFLASDESGWITGETIDASGGY